MSMSANPKAKPTSPNPATKAETLMPNVPRAVTAPKTIKAVLTVFPIRF